MMHQDIVVLLRHCIKQLKFKNKSIIFTLK